MPTFYFSRFRLNKDFSDYYDKALHLYESIGGKVSYEFRRDHYRFVGIYLDKIDGVDYITGRIIKYKQKHTESVLDDSSNSISEIVVNNKLLAAARFIIRPTEGIIAYEAVPSYIPKNTFPVIFANLLELNGTNNLKISVAPITNENAFFSRIDEIKHIKRITIDLVPSNPSNRDIWKSLDERLKRDNITNYRETQENKAPGGSINIDEETKSKMIMTEDGYGKATVEGQDQDGEYVKISTDDTDKHVSKRINFDFSQVTDYISSLVLVFQEIVKRTKADT